LSLRSYKVVKPTWITDSINAQKLLPWQDFRLVSTSSKQKELVVSRSIPTSGETLNAQILANDRTREMSTANPDFLDRFYKSSRLHYLSTWKYELKEIVQRLEESGVKKVDNRKRKRDATRIVM
jgi:DNA repair protein REV1